MQNRTAMDQKKRRIQTRMTGFAILGAGVVLLLAMLAGLDGAQAAPRRADPRDAASVFPIVCTSSVFADRIPVVVRINITAENQIETQGWTKSNQPSARMQLVGAPIAKAQDVLAFELTDRFFIDGREQAKLLLTKHALHTKSPDAMNIVLMGSRQVLTYQCARVGN